MSVDDDSPKDRYYLVYIVFFMQGVGMLFPWNVFITANEYFKIRFQGSEFVDNFQSYFSIAFMLFNTGFMYFLMATKYDYAFKVTHRIVFSLSLNVVVFVFTAAMVMIDISSTNYFYFTIMLIMLSGISTGILQKAFYGLASEFPPIYIQGMMVGQGVAGLVVCVVSILTVLFAVDPTKQHLTAAEKSPEDVSMSSFVYFLVAVAVVVICIASFISLKHNRFYRHFTHNVYTKCDTTETDVTGSEKGLIVNSSVEDLRNVELPSVKQVLLKIKGFAFSTFITYFITLTLFPSIVTSIEKTNSTIPRELFVPFLLLTFNIGDLIGKFLPGLRFLSNLHTEKNDVVLVILSAFRLVFFPLFLLSNVTLRDSNNLVINAVLKPVFKDDGLVFMFVALFALTNGYLGSIVMMRAPSYVSDNEKELSGSILAVCLTTGLTIGSLFSFALRAVACDCNPFIS